ncbi:T9SS type A sorting domain-containing protein, partial [bacterium]|nr:T9SS type A sorting domain-containing protein [bacterium]
IPVEFGLKSAYPNPFNSTIVISFAVNSSERTTLRVFDITGREVATIVDAEHTAGIQTTIWNAEGLPSGVYIVKLNSGNRSQFSKVILLR